MDFPLDYILTHLYCFCIDTSASTIFCSPVVLLLLKRVFQCTQRFTVSIPSSSLHSELSLSSILTGFYHENKHGEAVDLLEDDSSSLMLQSTVKPAYLMIVIHEAESEISGTKNRGNQLLTVFRTPHPKFEKGLSVIKLKVAKPKLRWPSLRWTSTKDLILFEMFFTLSFSENVQCQGLQLPQTSQLAAHNIGLRSGYSSRLI